MTRAKKKLSKERLIEAMDKELDILHNLITKLYDIEVNEIEIRNTLNLIDELHEEYYGKK